MSIEFGILGPLEVTARGRPIELGGAKQRAVLADLLIHANQVVPIESLIEHIWGEEAPKTAANVVQVHISALRRAIGSADVKADEILVARSPGYVLKVGQDELDVTRFEALASEGRAALATDPKEAAEGLQKALGLWRGAPLSDFLFESFAQQEISRLEEAKQAALEDRIQADLALGEDSALIGELRAMVREHPLRERPREQLMLALYRSGRQAEALELYRQTREILAEELGIDPSPALQRLERGVLAQDPSLELLLATAPAKASRLEAERIIAREASQQPKTGPHLTRRVVTVLFTDVAGFTALGEGLDPEQLRYVMSRFFDVMRSVVERHGGVVEKFIGDAVMAVFGVPAIHEDDPLRAVRAAAEMQQALGRLNERLKEEQRVTLAIRTGVATGEVVAGDTVAEQRLVTGDTVSIAARLEQYAAPGEILIGESLYRLVRDAVEVEPVEPLELKGKAEPLTAYRLMSVRTGTAAHARKLDSPMVGRDRERRLITDALDRAWTERTCYLFTLLGAAGVGKSRLVLEFLKQLPPVVMRLSGRCLSYGEGITFLPLAEVVRRAADIADDETQEAGRAKIERILGGRERAAVIATRVAELIGLQEGALSSEDALWAVRTFLEALAEDQPQPLVVVFEDIHWAEPALLDLIEHVAEWSRDAPILLLCVARPELLDLRPGWGGGKMNATSILLESLGPADASLLINHLLGSDGLPSSTQAKLLDAAEGNPLFLEEMLRMLVDDGLLTREESRWVPTADMEGIAIPPTIQLVLAARLDRLDEDEKDIAQRASVEGKTFHRGALVHLCPNLDVQQVEMKLQSLARKELIRSDVGTIAGEVSFRFHHQLLRDVAYDRLPKVTRFGLHERFGDWLLDRAGERLPEYEDILGYHWEQAYRYRADLGPVDDSARALALRAATALASAGRRASVRDDHHAAAGLLRRAVELDAFDGPDDRHLRYELAEELMETGEFREAEELTRQVLEEAREAEDERFVALASVLEVWLRAVLDLSVPLQAALDEASEAARVLDKLGDARGALRAMTTVGSVTFYLGRADEGLGQARRDLETARTLDAPREIRLAIEGIASCLYYGSTPVSKAVEEIENTLPQLADSPGATARAIHPLPALYAMQARFDEAREASEQATLLWGQVGDPLRLAGLALWVGPMHMLAGQRDEAERVLRQSANVLEALGDKGGLSSIAAELAEVLVSQGLDEEAERVAGDAALAPEDDITAQYGWRSVMAKVLADRGRFDEAERMAREAIELGDRTDYINEQAGLWSRLGEVLQMAGKEEDAAKAKTEALALYQLKGNVVMTERLRQELGKSSQTAPS